MSKPLPVVLIPGLNCSARLYAEQIPPLWRFGPAQVADHTRANSMDVIAAQILAAAGLSQEIAAGVAGSRLVVAPDCGHLSTMEQPDAVNRALGEWMES